MLYLGSLNNVVLFRESTWMAFVFNSYKGIGCVSEIRSLATNNCEIFQDKLADMNGYQYKTLLIRQYPRIAYKKKKLYGIDSAIFSEIAKHQNASMNLQEIHYKDPKKLGKMEYAMETRQADLTLNTFFLAPDVPYNRFINTYDQNGFCALVPIPKRLSFLNYLLSPFDGWSWTFLIISSVACAFTFKYLSLSTNNPNSVWYFMFYVVASFVGQSVTLREHRRIQKTLVQLVVLMTFIMGNAYQSLIIATMTTSRDGTRMKTFDEIFENTELKFEADVMFYDTLQQSGEYSSVLQRMKIVNPFLSAKNLSLHNYAIIARCDLLEAFMRVGFTVDMAQYYYLLPDKVLPFFEKFMLPVRSPFYKKLQTYHDLIFESGIRYYWHDKIDMKPLAERDRAQKYLDNEEYYLKLDDIYGIFYILLGGYAISLLVLIVEIFWHDFLRYVNFKRLFRKAMLKYGWKKRTIRVRRIQVQPMEA